MYAEALRQPAAHAALAQRQKFLRQVGGYTFAGLVGSFSVALACAYGLFVFIDSVPLLFNRWVQLGVIFGSFGIVQMPATQMAHSEGSTKYVGFALGVVFQGIAMSYLLFTAGVLGMSQFGNPFQLIFEALGITMLMAVGMLAYLLTGPKELSLVKAGLSLLGLPMLALMVLSFVFPIGGTLGLGLTALFVVVSAGGVLYQLNSVLYRYPANAPVPAAFSITIGLLVLYWNILSLVMRSRD